MRNSIYFLCFTVILLSGCNTTSEIETTELTTNFNNFDAQIISTEQQETTSFDNTATISNTKSNISKKRMTIEEMCESVLNGIQNEDKTLLKELFCEKIASTHNLDDELTSFYNFIDGKFIFFTDYHKDLRYGSESDKGTYVKYHISVKIRSARTDTDKEYVIEFYANLVQDNEPDKIGLEYIVIKNSEGEKLWVGEYIGN